MDTATTVALFGFAGVVISTMVGAFVALLTNRTEKKQTAETTMERTLRERLVLKDEQLADAANDLARMTRDRDRWKAKAMEKKND